MKITTTNAKLLVLGTYNEYRSFMNLYGQHVEGVKFERISSEKSLKSRHAKTTRILVLSDELGLLSSPKAQRLNPVGPGFIQNRINEKLAKRDQSNSVLTMAYGSSIKQIHKSINEAA